MSFTHQISGGSSIPVVGTDLPASLAAEQALVPHGGIVALATDLSVGTAPVANVRGTQIAGPGFATYTPSVAAGKRVQNPTGREDSRLAWGSEYLFQWLNKLTSGVAAKIVVSGDSTAAPLAAALTPLLSARYPNVTVVAAGVSGQNTGQWLATHLAADIAAAPTLLIWHWGMNDSPSQARTPAQFIADMRAGLAQYRAALPIALSGIVLMTPNAASDGATGRDEYRGEVFRDPIRQAAVDYQAAFFDTSAIYQDGYVGVGGPWMDAAAVHPSTVHNQAIAGSLLDLIVPTGTRLLSDGKGWNLVVGVNPLASEPVTNAAIYKRGGNVHRATGLNGWPLDGYVSTVYSPDNTTAIQTVWAFNADVAPQVRTFLQGPGVWGVWRTTGVAVGDVPAAVAPSALFTAPGADSMRTFLEPVGWASGAGYINTPGILAVGTVLGTVAVGHRPIGSWRLVPMDFWTGGTPTLGASWIHARGLLNPDGTLVLVDAVSTAVSRAYLAPGARWRVTA